MVVSGAVKCRQNVAHRLVRGMSTKSLGTSMMMTTTSSNKVTIDARTATGHRCKSSQTVPGMLCSSKSLLTGDHPSSSLRLDRQTRSVSFANLFGMFNSTNVITEALLKENSENKQEQEQVYVNFEDLQSKHLVPAANEIQTQYESDLKALEQSISEKNEKVIYDDLVPELERISRPIMTLQNIIQLYSSVMMKNDPSFFNALHEANEILQLTHERSTILRDALIEIRSDLDGDENDYENEVKKRSVDHLLRKQFLRGTYNPTMFVHGGDADNKAVQEQIEATNDRLTKVYQKFITKSSMSMEEHGKSATPQDLLQMMYEIVALQNHLAKLSGFDTFASYSLFKHNTMVKDVSEISSLHQEFGKDVGSIEKFSSDDFQSKYLDLIAPGSSIVDEKDYFELNSVLGGLFGLCNDLFGIIVEEETSQVKGWHRDVRLFHVYDESSMSGEEGTTNKTRKHIGSFYLDPFRRLNKNLGCFAVPIQYARDGVSIPTVALSMDMYSPTWDDSPQQMDVTNVVNLFHEFGHVLEHILCDVKLGAFSGAHLVEEDATEAIAQFMEYWLFEGGMIEKLAKRNVSGDALPTEAVEHILERRKNAKATELLHRLFLGQLEVEVNAHFDPHGDESIVSVQRNYAEQFCPHHLPPRGNIDPLVQIFQNSALGRSTMQYRYLFSDIISADAFEAFFDENREPLKGELLRERGMMFREYYLEVGSSRSTAKGFEDFRGRKVDSRALLSRYGLA